MLIAAGIAHNGCGGHSLMLCPEVELVVACRTGLADVPTRM
jgi:hypothetical protein